MTSKVSVLLNKPPTVFNFNVLVNSSVLVKLPTTRIVEVGIVSSIVAGGGASNAQINEMFNQMNPLPISFYANEDITQFQIEGANLRTALVFADGRLLANCQIVGDTIIFNETIMQYQQVFINYQINLS